LLLKFFFRLSIHALVVKIQPNKVVRWGQDVIFVSFSRPVFPTSRMQHVSDLHLKFALRPHHVWKYGRRPLCYCCLGEERKKDRRYNKKPQGKHIMSTSATQGGHKKESYYDHHKDYPILSS